MSDLNCSHDIHSLKVRVTFKFVENHESIKHSEHTHLVKVATDPMGSDL